MHRWHSFSSSHLSHYCRVSLHPKPRGIVCPQCLLVWIMNQTLLSFFTTLPLSCSSPTCADTYFQSVVILPSHLNFLAYLLVWSAQLRIPCVIWHFSFNMTCPNQSKHFVQLVFTSYNFQGLPNRFICDLIECLMSRHHLSILARITVTHVSSFLVTGQHSKPYIAVGQTDVQ